MQIIRSAPRYQTKFDALCSSGREEGAGVLEDISCSGALLESASLRPPVGTKVRLYVFVQPISPFELVGHVVRHTESGFAIEYDRVDDELRALVGDVAEIVSSPQSS